MKTFIAAALLTLGIMPLLATSPPLLQASVDSTIDKTGPNSYTRSINKLFQVNATGEVKLDNRYGDIDYAVWDRNEVKVSVTIEVDARNESRAQQTFDRIDIEFDSSPSFVGVKTDLASGGGSSWTNGGCSFKIHYRVSAPQGFDLDASNRYGDVRVPDLFANATFDIGYGDLFGGNVGGSTKLEVAYGSAKLGALKDLESSVRYSEVDIRSATDTKYESRYSETSIRRVGRLALESQHDDFVFGSVKELVNTGRYDDFRIDSAWSVTVASRYTDVKIGYLAKAADLQMRYGDATINGTAAQLSGLEMSGDYTAFSVRLNPELRYEVEANARYADIDLPKSLTIVRREQSGSTSKLAGHSHTSPQAKVVLAANYGSIRVR